MTSEYTTTLRLTWLFNIIEDGFPAFSFLAPIPQESPHQSAAQVVAASPPPDGLLNDNTEGNRFLHWRIGGLRHGSIAEVDCEFAITLRHSEDMFRGLRIDEIASQTAEPRYTQRFDSEPDARLIHKFVAAASDSLAELLDRVWQHTVEFYQGQDVNCGHYAYRIMQLLRIVGIPCRNGFGTVGLPRRAVRLFNSDTSQKYPNVGVKGSDGSVHTWVELLVPGIGWVGFPNSYWPFSIRYSSCAPNCDYTVTTYGGRTVNLALVGDSGTHWFPQVQTEFTCLAGPSLRPRDAVDEYPQGCAYLVGMGMGCSGHINGRRCCLYCPFRSRKCAFMSNYGSWHRACRSCARLWTADTEAVLEGEISAQINALGDKTRQQEASGNLLRYAKDAVPYLIKATTSTSAEKRVWAAHTLSRFSPELVVDSVHSSGSNPVGRWPLKDILTAVRSCYAMTNLANYAHLKQVCDAVIREFA